MKYVSKHTVTVKLFFDILFYLHFNAYLWSNLKRSAIKIPAKRHKEERVKDCHMGQYLHVHCFYLMRPHVTHTLGHTFIFHSCVSRARTPHASALSPLVSSYGVCQLTTMGFFTLMKSSARNVCTFFNVQ